MMKSKDVKREGNLCAKSVSRWRINGCKGNEEKMKMIKKDLFHGEENREKNKKRKRQWDEKKRVRKKKRKHVL